MLEKLTKEHKQIMLETRDEWINLFLDNVKEKRGINKPQFEEGVRWLYTDLLKKPMPKVVYCDSWISCLNSISILKNQNVVGGTVRDVVRDVIGGAVGDVVGGTVRDVVWGTVRDVVWGAVRDVVGGTVRGVVRDVIRGAVRDVVWGTVREISYYVDISNYGWVAFYNFFEKIGVFNNRNFKAYKNLLQSGVFGAYEYENYIFAIQPPISVELNSQGRLHSTAKMAVEFKDDSGYYLVNGRSIPERVFKEPITKETFLKESNSDIKGAMYEILGQKGMFNLLGAKVIDETTITHSNGDVETIKLLKTTETFKEIDNQPFAWVSMVCPSTGTNYLQGVESKHINALEAIASLSPLSAEEYSFNLRS